MAFGGVLDRKWTRICANGESKSFSQRNTRNVRKTAVCSHRGTETRRKEFLDGIHRIYWGGAAAVAALALRGLSGE